MVLFVRALSLSVGGKFPDDFRLQLFVPPPGRPGQADNEHKLRNYFILSVETYGDQSKMTSYCQIIKFNNHPWDYFKLWIGSQ